ncbi:polyprenyl synthetase family protein [Actinotalea sp. AC32]|nr:polyprenyl synthetase family protein [Actinotalea sp. AC32]
MTTPASALVDVDGVRAGVDQALRDHLDALRAELAHHGRGVEELVDAMAATTEGGKRLRAAFCFWSWHAHGGAAGRHAAAATRATVLRVGAALELFQAAALVHDDVMDQSDTRRGRPAAHRHFATEHARRGWGGPSEQFGVAAAVLLGDLALVESERELAAALVTTDVRVTARARATFDEMRTEVTVGQFLDVLAQVEPTGPDAQEQRARAVIRAKSARYSVEHPIVIGAALAGASPEELERCRRTGLALGEAFQLRDDLLGVFGDPAATGKPAGDDLREGKRTVLVARTLARAGDEDRATVLRHLGDRDLVAADVDRVRAAMVRSGAVADVEALIDELAGPALTELAAADLEPTGRDMLVRLGRSAVTRQA